MLHVKLLISKGDNTCRNAPLPCSPCKRAALEPTGKHLGVTRTSVVLLCFFFLALLQVPLVSAHMDPLQSSSVHTFQTFLMSPKHALPPISPLLSSQLSNPYRSVCKHFCCYFESFSIRVIFAFSALPSVLFHRGKFGLGDEITPPPPPIFCSK